MNWGARSDVAPVFIVGSARSGTTLLYHTLLSSGQYAIYRGEPAVFDLVQPRYGDLRLRAARWRLLQEWPNSHLAHAAGLDDPAACARLVEKVRSNGEFLRAVMTRLAARQGMRRWAVWGPDNLLLMPWIKREMPDARFVHMVRDGRDVALSMGTEEWIAPFPWDRRSPILVAALHWQWKVRRGRGDGASLGNDYAEFSFEALVSDRASFLRRLAAFLGHEIDARAIEEASVGTLRRPNSTFASDGTPPVGRWRERMSPETVASVERAIGATLETFGYRCASRKPDRASVGPARLYSAWFTGKHVLRTYTPFGRLVDPGRLRFAHPSHAVVAS